MKVKPAEGRKVRDPATKRHIPDEGVEVPDTAKSEHRTYWLRRIREGDVVLVKDPVVQISPIPDSPSSQD